MEVNGITLLQGFNIDTTQTIDRRLVLSADDISKVGEASQQVPASPYNLGKWPEHYFVLCSDDGQMYEFHKDATAPNGCVFTKITRPIDEVTILEDINGKAYVPIDNKTIVVENGLLKAVPEELVDGVATKVRYTSEGKETVDVLFDEERGIAVVNKRLYVKVDRGSIKIDSEGKLYVDLPVLVDDDTIKVVNGKFTAQYKVADKKGLKLDDVTFEVIVDNDKVKFDSEGKLTADFLRYVGSEGIKVEDEKITAVVDGETILVGANGLEVQVKEAVGKAADGLFIKKDDHTIILTSEGKLRVPVDALVHSVDPIKVTVANDEATFELKFDDTLEVTSEGKLHAVAKQAVASEGIIVVPVGETSIISVDLDKETILLGSEGLHVNVMPKQGLEMARGAGNKPLGFKVKVDGATVTINSEGALQSTSTPLNVIAPIEKTTAPDGTITLKILYDNKTVLNGSEGLYVPIDKDTIILDGGVIKAKKQLNADGLTILENSEILSVNIDNKTLISTNGVIETAVGGWIENPQQVTFINDTYSGTAPIFTHIGGGVYRFEGQIGAGLSPVPQDGQMANIKLGLKAGATTIQKDFNDYVFIDYGTTISTGDGTPTDELRNFTYEKATGKFIIELMPTDTTLFPVIGGLDLEVDGVLGVYHPIDAKFIPVDGTSIIVKNGKLVTSAPSITAGDALEYVITPTANTLNVLADSETIAIRDNKLYAPLLTDHTAAEEDLVLTINSEGKPQFLQRAGVTDVQLEGVSLVKDYIATIPVASDSERGVIKFDNDTLILNSEGQLKVVRLVEDVLVKELTSEGTSEASIVVDREAKLDLTPYSKLEDTGYRIELLVDGQHADSEVVGDSEAKYVLSARLLDKAGNVITTSNVADFPIEKMIVGVRTRAIPTSEGTFQTILVFELVNGQVIEIPMATITSGYITQFGDYVGTNSIYGTKNFDGELMNYGHEVVTQVQFDNKTVKWNDSEIYVEAILPEGRKAIELVDLGANYVYDVKYNDETVKVNSENELYVPIDEETIVLNAGKVKANIDNRTIIYDTSEQHIELPLDEVTIFVNSQGLLEAAGLDVKAGEAIEINNSEEAGLPVKKINVLYDNETVMLNSENELYIPLDYETIIIDSENKIALPIDRKTIFIDSESGLLKAAGLTVSEGEAIKITTSEVDGVEQAIIDVRYDNETILINSENELYVPLDHRTVIIDSEGKVALPLDNKTIFIDSETNLIKAAGLVVSEGLAIEIENSELDGVAQAIINVKYDELAGLEVNSENELFVKLDLQSLKFNSEGEAYAHLDEETIVLDSEGAIHAKIDYDTLIINSEGFIAVDRLTVPEVDAIWHSIVI